MLSRLRDAVAVRSLVAGRESDFLRCSTKLLQYCVKVKESVEGGTRVGRTKVDLSSGMQTLGTRTLRRAKTNSRPESFHLAALRQNPLPVPNNPRAPNTDIAVDLRHRQLAEDILEDSRATAGLCRLCIRRCTEDNPVETALLGGLYRHLLMCALNRVSMGQSTPAMTLLRELWCDRTLLSCGMA